MSLRKIGMLPSKLAKVLNKLRNGFEDKATIAKSWKQRNPETISPNNVQNIQKIKV